MSTEFKKRHKPVTRFIWNLLSHLPTFFRKKIVRSLFEISYTLSPHYVFKLAETEEEVEQALRIVYEAYTHLGYIDEHPDKVHFNAFLCLPITSIIVIKYKHEVIGTVSIVPDSLLGLPSEMTWNLKHIKSETLKIAEVSALTIKRGHKTSKGHLLLTLCKFIYQYCTEILRIDGVVFAATQEVEPFYTDVLLFKRVTAERSKKHDLVKGNRSTCCFVDYNKVRGEYIEEYNYLPKERNLFHFFTEFKSPNIQLPEPTISLHGLLHEQNKSMLKVLSNHPTLAQMFSQKDKEILANMDPTFALDSAIEFDARNIRRIYPRLSIRNMSIYIHHGPSDLIFNASLADISAKGFGLKFLRPPTQFRLGDKCIMIVKWGEDSMSIHAILRGKYGDIFGFQVSEPSSFDWRKIVSAVFLEVQLPINHKRKIQNAG